jgi:acetyltransferase
MPSIHYLNSLFEPRSIAVIGASEKSGSIGHVILKNILANGYKGDLFAVNPRYSSVLGQPCLASIEKTGSPVDLAIITTAPRTIAEIIAQCGRAGVRNAIVVTNPGSVAANSATTERRIRDAALNAGVRFLGPKSLGIVSPHASINATFTEIPVTPGDLALVAQSGAMCAAVLDWASANRVGMSLAVSLGEAMNIDFGDVLDYLANDDRTRYILLHVEKIRHARRFISALRSAARIKPVILLKSGHHAGEENAELDDLELSDQVFDAAVQRAGVVRVKDLSQLFHAARALASGFHPRGSRLAILSNGTGPAHMAVDSARRLGVPVPRLQSATVSALRSILPREWQGQNPIDLGGDASSERFLETARIVAQDEQIDAVLVVLSPLALVSPQAVAEGLVEISRTTPITLCCCFMGGEQVSNARQILEQAGIPVFRTPDTVIALFHNISTYYLNQKMLLQVPSPCSSNEGERSGSGRALVDALIAERRRGLSRMETHTLLHAYGVHVRQSMVAHSAVEAMFLAEQIGLPVDIQLESTDLRDEYGDKTVRRKLSSIESVRSAVLDLIEAKRQKGSEQATHGVSIARYIDRSAGRQFLIRVFHDPVFGPVILLGAGGSHGEALRDYAVALPPLNRVLARNLINATRIGRSLGAADTLPEADDWTLEEALLCISRMVCELPSLGELEINPLVIDEQGRGMVLDARLSLDPARGAGQARYAHMAIHPYPAHLCQEWPMQNGSVVRVRPVRPEDAPLEQAFVDAMSDESRHFRFMDSMRELPPSQIIRLTQVDYDREMGLVAVVNDDGKERQVGSARYVQTPDGESVEFGLAVADSYQKCGLGRRLMEATIECAREKLYRTMVGDVLADNHKMLKLMTRLGFSIMPHPDDNGLKRVTRLLRD